MLQVIDHDDSPLAEYTDLGLGTIVKEDFSEPEVRLDYTGTSAGSYPGLDRLDRIVQQLWRYYGTGAADRDKFSYGFDRDSNPLYKENVLATAQSELYQLDGLDRLTTFKRGTLNGGKTDITNPSRQEDFDLDPTGNWGGYEIRQSGSLLLAQERTHDARNEITAIDQGGGQPAWPDPAYDSAGNTTAAPQPLDPTSSFELKYDGWDRLKKVIDGETDVAQFEYDGLHRRIGRAAGARRWDDYYNDAWQLLESRESESDSLLREERFVWSLRYLDAPILRDATEFESSSSSSSSSSSETIERLYWLSDAKMNTTCLVSLGA